MKTTLDIPDAVYREFKIKTAVNGETMRKATLAFILAYNSCNGNPLNVVTVDGASRTDENTDLPEWAGIAEKFIKRYPDGRMDNEKLREKIVAAKRKGMI